MNPRYHLADSAEIITPALLVFYEIVCENIDKIVRMAGAPQRLRPHCKTHKMKEVVRLQLAKGITKHKAATVSEAEMLAEAGVDDVLLAYHLVGPNIGRAVRFVQKFPNVALAVIADQPEPIGSLAQAMAQSGNAVEVLLDLDTGQHRTGIAISSSARQLYEMIVALEGVRPGGLHIYDGQNHQRDVDERRTAVHAVWDAVAQFRDSLQQDGLPVPRVVAGGTGSFPIFAAIDDPTIEVSPGTCVFNDVGYGEMFPDLDFSPAALLLTRVISLPTSDRVTLDLGYKAVASDPPLERRVVFPDIPDARTVLQNEEHLVIETTRAGEFRVGDELMAIPHHICPTSALHKQAFVIEQGRVQQQWNVAARDRWLTI